MISLWKFIHVLWRSWLTGGTLQPRTATGFVLVVLFVLVGRDPVFCTFFWGTWQISGTLEHFHRSYFAFKAILIKSGKNDCPWNEYISFHSTTAKWGVKVGKVHQKFCTQAWLHIYNLKSRFLGPRCFLMPIIHRTSFRNIFLSLLRFTAGQTPIQKENITAQWLLNFQKSTDQIWTYFPS